MPQTRLSINSCWPRYESCMLYCPLSFSSHWNYVVVLVLYLSSFSRSFLALHRVSSGRLHLTAMIERVHYDQVLRSFRVEIRYSLTNLKQTAVPIPVGFTSQEMMKRISTTPGIEATVLEYHRFTAWTLETSSNVPLPLRDLLSLIHGAHLLPPYELSAQHSSSFDAPK